MTPTMRQLGRGIVKRFRYRVRKPLIVFTYVSTSIAYASCGTGNQDPSRYGEVVPQPRSNVMLNVAKKTIQLEANWEVWAIAFSPDTREIAASSPNSAQVKVWDWQSKRLLETLEVPRTSTTNGLRYSPAGDVLAAAHNVDSSGSLIRIWNTDSWRIASDIVDPIGGSQFFGIAFSPHGNLFFRSQQVGRDAGDTLAVYSTQTWKRSWGLDSTPFQPDTLAVNFNGDWAAIAGATRLLRDDKPYLQPQIALVSIANKRLVKVIDVLSDGCEVQFLAWSLDGDRIAIGGRPVFSGSRISKPTVQIFSISSGEKLAEYASPVGTHVRGLSYSPNNRYLIIAWEGVVEIWDTLHTNLLQSMHVDAGAIAISSDSQYMAIGGLDKKISLWNLQ